MRYNHCTTIAEQFFQLIFQDLFWQAFIDSNFKDNDSKAGCRLQSE